MTDRYAVSNGSGYAILICWDEYAVLDRKLDTPYLMEVDTPYLMEVDTRIQLSTRTGLEVGWIRCIQDLDTAYWGFLGVGTTFDIFQNIILIQYLESAYLSLWIRNCVPNGVLAPGTTPEVVLWAIRFISVAFRSGLIDVTNVPALLLS
ncbi:hypothetical protein Tco_1185979 [Tanacetum coccineum]